MALKTVSGFGFRVSGWGVKGTGTVYRTAAWGLFELCVMSYEDLEMSGGAGFWRCMISVGDGG